MDVTTAQLEAAFTEWERRYREEPTRFSSEAEQRAASAETYGQAAAESLLFFLAETNPSPHAT